MIYIPFDGTEQEAAALSKTAYAATCSGGAIPHGSITQYAFGWIVHPTTGAVAFRAGNVAEISGLVPDSAIAAAMTYDQAVAVGWFPKVP